MMKAEGAAGPAPAVLWTQSSLLPQYLSLLKVPMTRRVVLEMITQMGFSMQWQ
jgi:hypothetical protein